MINFGVGRSIAVPKRLLDGSVIANPTPVVLGTMQDISVDMSLELKKLHGARRYPIAVAQSKGEISIKAKYADFIPAIYGSLFAGKAATNALKGVDVDKPFAIPATSPYTVTAAPSNSGTFVSDMGVIDANGDIMTRVASAPTAGQYSVSAGGVYTFAAADASKTGTYGYEYNAVSTTGQVFELTNDVMGPTPSFSLYLQQKFDGKTLVMKFNKVVSGKMNLPFKNDDFALYDFEAEALDDGTGSLGWLALY
jgi:hypothetical protein